MRPLGLRHVSVATGITIAVLAAIVWWLRPNPYDGPAVRIAGGGFIFNYRVADNYIGFTAVLDRSLPVNTILEAHFEDPAGGPEIVVRERVHIRSLRYALRTPPLSGIEAGRPYRVLLRVLDHTGENEIERHETSFTSQISDDVAPKEPLTVGPGYAPNPDAAPDRR